MSAGVSALDGLYENFRNAQQDDRPDLVANILLENRDSFRCIVQVAATRSIDEGSFLRGLRIALERDAENLPALRLLIWHRIWIGAWEEAKEAQRLLISCWPNIPDIRREFVRVSMMAPGPDGEEALKLAASELRTPLAQFSCVCQYALAGLKTVPADRLRELKLNIDDFCGEIFKESVTPDPLILQQNSTVYLEVMEKILGSKSVALVANGPSLKGRGLGQEIDAHDLVIRCNFPEFTRFCGDVGRKADIVFFNEFLVNVLPELMAREPAYNRCAALAFHPKPAAQFIEEHYLRSVEARVSRIQPKLREIYRSFFYTRPTTGLMGIILISVVLRKNLDIYGFDFYNHTTAHYFPSSAPVFLGHELQYEQWFLKHFLPWIGLGKITAQ